jgi:hypothetical protein
VAPAGGFAGDRITEGSPASIGAEPPLQRLGQAPVAKLAWIPTCHGLRGPADAGVTLVTDVVETAVLVEPAIVAGHPLLDLVDSTTAAIAQSDLRASEFVLAAGNTVPVSRGPDHGRQ